MKKYKSLLFIPGNKSKWLKNMGTHSADALILDLEDSVPEEQKKEAQKNVRKALLNSNSSTKSDIFVRINRTNDEFDNSDLEAVMHHKLTGIVLPKVYSTKEVDQLSSKLTKLEKESGIPVGQTKLLPILETAKSMYYCYEIAKCDRVIGLTGLSSKNGDVERALGTKWTFEGLETLYMKSKVVMAARATNVTPIGGLWQDVHDLDGLKISAKKNRELGFDGELVLHPSNVSIINEIYSPSQEELVYYEGLIDTFNKAKAEGSATIIYQGSHIDIAHVQTAKEILKSSKMKN